jgi:hypothetical protein
VENPSCYLARYIVSASMQETLDAAEDGLGRGYGCSEFAAFSSGRRFSQAPAISQTPLVSDNNSSLPSASRQRESPGLKDPRAREAVIVREDVRRDCLLSRRPVSLLTSFALHLALFLLSLHAPSVAS